MLYCSLQSKGSSPWTDILISASNNRKCFHSLVIIFFFFEIVRNCDMHSHMEWNNEAIFLWAAECIVLNHHQSTKHFLQWLHAITYKYRFYAIKYTLWQLRKSSWIVVVSHKLLDIPIRCQNNCLLHVLYDVFKLHWLCVCQN